MKKISLLIFTLVSLFVFTGNVFALTCSYNNSSDVLNSEKVSATYDFNSSGEVTYTDGVKINNDQLKAIQSQIASTGTCPLYAFYGKDKKMHLYYDFDQMTADNEAKGRFSVPCINDPQEYKEGKELLNKLSVDCNGVASTKFDYTKCWDEDKTLEKYSACQSEASALRGRIDSARTQVRGYAESGFIDQTSKEYNDMEKVCAAADKNLQNYEEALKYKSCNEYKKVVDGEIECKEDVEDNPYVKKKDDGESDTVDSKDSCGGVFGSINNKENFAYYLFHAFQIMKFLGPILVVVMSILDLVKITADPKQDDQLQKLGFKTLKRLVYAALIFVLPDLINYLFGLVGLYGTCGIY